MSQYVAWDGKTYQGQPPEGWEQATDQKWWPPRALPVEGQYQQPPTMPQGQPQVAQHPLTRTQPITTSNKAPRPWWQKKRFMIPIGLFVGIGIAAAVTSDSPTGNDASTEVQAFDEQADSSDTTTGEATTTTTQAPTTTEAPTTIAPSAVIDPGTYIIGTEIPPGVYRVDGYWATLDENQEILANDLVLSGLTIAVIPEDAVFVEFNGDAMTVEDLPAVDPLAEGFTEGTYLVGPDIAPGQYRVSDNDFAYAARLDSDLDIIDNAGNEGSVILTIQETDFAFTFNGTLEKIS